MPHTFKQLKKYKRGTKTVKPRLKKMLNCFNCDTRIWVENFQEKGWSFRHLCDKCKTKKTNTPVKEEVKQNGTKPKQANKLQPRSRENKEF